MEKSRLNRESRDRKSERMVKKSGPWHDPQPENGLKKIALQSGIASPSEVGLQLDVRKNGEKSSLELRQAFKPTPLVKDSSESLPGQPQQGRPKLSKDTETRKQKQFKPQTGAKLLLWATQAQDNISNIINPIMLEFYQKKNLRSLSNAEAKELENLKAEILFGLKPFCTINSEYILEKISTINNQYLPHYSVWIKGIVSEFGRELTIDEQKQAKAAYYSFINQ
jgi:hypothetical protein